MLDISFSELISVAVVAIVVLGPEDVPKLLYGLGRVARRLNYLRFSLTQQFDSFMDKQDGGNGAQSVNFETRHTPLRPFPPSPADGIIEFTEDAQTSAPPRDPDPEKGGS